MYLGKAELSSFDPTPFHLLSLSFTRMHIIKCNNLCKQHLNSGAVRGRRKLVSHKHRLKRMTLDAEMLRSQGKKKKSMCFQRETAADCTTSSAMHEA